MTRRTKAVRREQTRSLFSQARRDLAENMGWIEAPLALLDGRHREVLSTLKKLFSSSPVNNDRVVETPPQVRDRHGGKVKPGAGPAGVSPAEIDAAFYGLVLGVQSPIDSPLNAFEKKALRELDRLLTSDIAHSDLVPRLPAVIPRVMGVLRDESSSSADLASQLGRDAVLVSEVIRLANSPYFRVGKEIASLERAVFVLGRVGVRQLVANAAFKPLINLISGHFTKLSGTTLWEQSEKTAIACDCMAKAQGADRFDAYLMAIVANVGFIVALQILDRNFDGSEAPHSKLFHERLINRSRELCWIIARQWGFPVVVLEALESQIDTEQRQMLGSMLYAGDKLSKVHILSSRGRFRGDNERVAERLQGPLAAASKVCYEALLD